MLDNVNCHINQTTVCTDFMRQKYQQHCSFSTNMESFTGKLNLWSTPTLHLNLNLMMKLIVNIRLNLNISNEFLVGI